MLLHLKNFALVLICSVGVGLPAGAQPQPSLESFSLGSLIDLPHIAQTDRGNWVVATLTTKPGNAFANIKSVAINGTTGETYKVKGGKDTIRYVGELSISRPLLSNREVYPAGPIPYEIHLPFQFRRTRTRLRDTDYNARLLLGSGGEAIVEYALSSKSEMPLGRAYLLPKNWGRYVSEALTIAAQTTQIKEGEVVDFPALLRKGNPLVTLFALKKMKQSSALGPKDIERVADLFPASTRHVGLVALSSMQAIDRATFSDGEIDDLLRQFVFKVTIQDLFSLLDGLQIARGRADPARFEGKPMMGFGPQLLRIIRQRVNELAVTKESKALKKRLKNFSSPAIATQR